jgi:hypothetical protein
MARVRPLRKATTPIEGESARGLVCRALGDHGVPLSFNVLRRVGMLHRNVVTISEDADIDVDELARIIRVDVTEIEKRRYQPLGRKWYSFFGLELPSRAIEKRVRRFSPGSLSTSPHCRAIWELRDLPFCPESWELLIDRCVCGVRQGWIRLNGVHRCDDCGRLLSKMPTGSVAENLREALLIASGLASPLPDDQEAALALLPLAMRGVNRARLFDCVMRLRRALVGDAPDIDEDLSALHDACVAMARWPKGIAALTPNSRISSPAWSGIVGRYNDLVVSDPPSAKAPERTRLSINDVCVEAGEQDFNTKGNQALLGIRPAYELARLSSETLLAARERGHLQRLDKLRGGKLVPAFERADVEQFAAAFRRRLAPETVGYRLGLGRRAVQEVAACGHILSTGISLSNDEVWFTEEDIASFRARLESMRTGLKEPLRLKDALLVVNGRTKPWGSIVGAMLEGNLKFAFGDEDGKLFDTIAIERSARPELVRMASTAPGDSAWVGRVTKHEALEILNVSQNSRALDTLPSEGRNPITYSLEDVLGLAGRAVSVLELATVTGRTLASTYGLITSAGVEFVAGDMWSRQQAEDRIRSLAA